MPVLPLPFRPMKNSADTVAVPEDHVSVVEAKKSLTGLLHHAFMRLWNGRRPSAGRRSLAAGTAAQGRLC
jgi:hypothetical protein